MRIVQIIDSLEIGGAEKMAVNYANALSERIVFSGLVTTRREGNLKSQISNKVSYLFLERNRTIDFGATMRLRKYCKENKVDYLQPHSSSYFTAILVKIFLPKIKIIWHDHNGLSEFISSQKSYAIKIASFFLSGIIVVNYKLKNWAIKELFCKKVIYFPNFTSLKSTADPETILKGNTGKQILCLANLRHQKNHFLLLEVATALKQINPEWSFHLVGKDFEDDYSKQIFEEIKTLNLENNVYVYGSKNDTENIINQSEICILTSDSEGLPVSLLEYGLFKKPVVSTNVGEIPLIIENDSNGFVVPVKNAELFLQALLKLIHDQELRKRFGIALNKTVVDNNSEDAVIKNYINWIENI